MKEVTFVVEISTQIEDDADPADVVFDIDCGTIPPRSLATGEDVGHTSGYTTVNYYADGELE